VGAAVHRFGEEENLIGGKQVPGAAREGRRSPRLMRLLRRARRPAPSDITGVGALVGVTELVRAESDLPTVLALIARTVSDVLGFGTVVLNLYRPEWDDFCVTTVHGDEDVRQALLGSTYGWDGWAQLLDERFLRGGAFFIKHGEFDWGKDIGDRYVPERKVSENPEAWNPADEVFVPLADAGDELLGILSVGEPVSGLRPTDEELQLLVALAHHAAQALAAAQAAIVRERHRASLEELMHISSDLTRTLSTDPILHAVCNGIANALGFQKVCVDLLAEDGVTLITRAAAGWDPDERLVNQNLSLPEIAPLFDSDYELAGCFLVPSEVARERLDTSQVIYESELNGRGPHAWNHHWLVIPLHGPKEEIIGVIWADEPEDRLVPTEERLQALRIFANQAASALTLATQFEQMRFLADHDPLTNLLNRRSFVQQLDAEVSRSRRYERPLALVIFDLDELKTVNDTQGHAAGDEAIKLVADALRRTIRTGDNAFRIGGDEFAVILAEADERDAAAAAQRIADELQLAASFGVAVCASDCEAGALLREADDAMYRMKRRRRAEALRAGGEDLSSVV
jgi:diguanylate cyclase (GGDEF)-like protein